MPTLPASSACAWLSGQVCTLERSALWYNFMKRHIVRLVELECYQYMVYHPHDRLTWSRAPYCFWARVQKPLAWTSVSSWIWGAFCWPVSETGFNLPVVTSFSPFWLGLESFLCDHDWGSWFTNCNFCLSLLLTWSLYNSLLTIPKTLIKYGLNPIQQITITHLPGR